VEKQKDSDDDFKAALLANRALILAKLREGREEAFAIARGSDWQTTSMGARWRDGIRALCGTCEQWGRCVQWEDAATGRLRSQCEECRK
jgi:hypothetical protein